MTRTCSLVAADETNSTIHPSEEFLAKRPLSTRESAETTNDSLILAPPPSTDTLPIHPGHSSAPLTSLPDPGGLSSHDLIRTASSHDTDGLSSIESKGKDKDTSVPYQLSTSPTSPSPIVTPIPFLHTSASTSNAPFLKSSFRDTSEHLIPSIATSDPSRPSAKGASLIGQGDRFAESTVSHRRPKVPSSRRLLTRSLEFARKAVRLDSMGDQPKGAIQAYSCSLTLLNEVLERIKREGKKAVSHHRRRQRGVDEMQRLQNIV
jgi:hypothetical protein